MSESPSFIEESRAARIRDRKRLVIILTLLLAPIGLYVGTYAISDSMGEYRLYHDEMGIHWVWRGAGQWVPGKGKFDSRDSGPSLLGLIYFPAKLFDGLVLGRHPTLPAWREQGDGVYFEYPELGLVWEFEPGSSAYAVQIPGDTPQEARGNL